MVMVQLVIMVLVALLSLYFGFHAFAYCVKVENAFQLHTDFLFTRAVECTHLFLVLHLRQSLNNNNSVTLLVHRYDILCNQHIIYTYIFIASTVS